MITWNLDPTNYNDVQLQRLLEVVEGMDTSIATEISDYLESLKVEEETIPVTIATIKNTCGWSRYCDVTGKNHYMLKEWDVSGREIQDVKLSHAKDLGLCQ